MTTKISRPALRYFGGKWRIAPKIIPFIPRHETYIEPYGGAASVLLQKPPSRQEVYNDLNGDIVNFFKVLREQPEDLVTAIKLTPYARAEFEEAQDNTETFPVERARRFYVLCCMSFGAATRRSPSGWRIHKQLHGWSKSVVEMWNQVEYLYDVALRLKQVYIESQDALEVIRRWDNPDAFFYVDPPYPHSTRSGDNDYTTEMSDEQHIELADLLHSLKGSVIISSNPSPLYEKLYGKWSTFIFNERGLRNVQRSEQLWLSPKAIEIDQLPLFSMPMMEILQA